MFNKKEVKSEYRGQEQSPAPPVAKFNNFGLVKYQEPQSPVSNRSMPILQHPKSEGNFFLERVG